MTEKKKTNKPDMQATITFTKSDTSTDEKRATKSVSGGKSSKPRSWSTYWGRAPKSATPAPAIPQADFTIKKGEKPVKIGSLMGLEQVGQCIFIEYENDMIIVDAGMEFATKDTLGADYIIPDVSYVKKNIKKLKGIVLSHGHLDHVWALRDLLPELWFPTIYTTPLTLGIVKKTFDDKKLINKINYKLIDPDMDILKLGCFTIEFVHVNHNIPETMAMAIDTPKGMIFNSSDFKIDHTPAIGKPADLAKIARIGLEGVKLYIGDSLWSQKAGWSPSEREIGKTLEWLVEKAPGRMIVATFASNVWRVIQLIDSAIKNDRVVFLSGRSMINNVEICQEIGYIKAPKGAIRKMNHDTANMPDERVLILCTGAQGEEFSALARMARNEHSQITLRPGDTVLVSASVIPWNEIQAMEMKDNLVERWVRLVTNDEMDLHTSGHGGAEDHKLMLNLINPEYFLPYYLNAYFRYEHKKLGLQVGIPEERIMMPNKNGAIIEMYDEGCKIGNDHLQLDAVLIDGKGRGTLEGEYVIKARQIMGHDGVVNLILKIDSKTKELVGNIQIESRWFVYSNEVRSVHTKVVEFVKAKYKKAIQKRNEMKDVMRMIKDDLSEFLTKEVGRTPMIVPMYVYITKDGELSVQTTESKNVAVEKIPAANKSQSTQTQPVAKEQ